MVDDIYISFLKDYYAKHGTINDISYNTVVEYRGRKLKIGSFLRRIKYYHCDFLVGNGNQDAFSDLSIKRYEELDELGFIWNRSISDDDINIRFLRSYYAVHGTINDIPTTAIVEFEGKTLKIGFFLRNIKHDYKNYLQGISIYGSFSERSIYRYVALDEMNFNWEDKREGTKGIEEISDDICMECLKNFYDFYGSIEEIVSETAVKYRGKTLNIKKFIDSVVKKHNAYVNWGTVTNESLGYFTFLTKAGFVWPNLLVSGTVMEIANETGVTNTEAYECLRRFDGNVVKTKKVCQTNKKLREEIDLYLLGNYSIERLLREFGITKEALISSINGLRLDKTDKDVLYDPKFTLKDFCKINGYNYAVIVHAVKLRIYGLCTDDFESLINRCQIIFKNYGIIKPANWIFYKYGKEKFLRRVLTKIGADPNYVLRDMTCHVFNMETALKRESFRLNCDDAFSYLEGIYSDLVKFYETENRSTTDKDELEEKVSLYTAFLAEEYQLTDKEFENITKAFSCYTSMTYNFHLFDVAFEQSVSIKIAKIIKYHFDDDDLEEAYLIPLSFDDGKLIGEDNELYQRRVIIKNLTVCWNDLNEDERQEKTLNYGLTEKELNFIMNTRSKIDMAKQKVKRRL